MKKTLLLMAGIVAFLGVPRANATVEVRIVNGAAGDTGWITCADPTCNFVGVVGNFQLASDIAFKFDGINPFLDMAYSASTTVANAGTLVIEAMASGYMTNTPSFTLIANGNSHLGDTATVAMYGGNNNTICAAGANACTPGSITNTLGTSAPFLDAASGYDVHLTSLIGNTANPYSLGVSITLADPVTAGTASGDLALDAVPEPASIALLGGALLFGMSALRKKMRRS